MNPHHMWCGLRKYDVYSVVCDTIINKINNGF